MVKGEECDKTNEFLRDLFSVASSGRTFSQVMGPEPQATNQPTSQTGESKPRTSIDKQKVENRLSIDPRKSTDVSVKQNLEKPTKPQAEPEKPQTRKTVVPETKSKEKENEKMNGEEPAATTGDKRKLAEESTAVKNSLGQELQKNIDKDEKILVHAEEPKAIKMGKIAEKSGPGSHEYEVEL